MSLIAKAKSGSFELPPEGTFQGVVFAVYDGGDQPDNFNPGETVQKMRFGIELNELYSTGPYAGQRITRYPEYTVSLSEKSNLLPVVESMLNRALEDGEKEGFDLESLIGSNCQVSITHKEGKNGKVYADNRIGALMKGIQLIKPILQSDYKPDFIRDWQTKGNACGETIKTEPDKGDQIGTLTKVQMFNAIQENLKKNPALKPEFTNEWLSLGGTLIKVTDDQITELFWKYAS